MFRVRTAFLFQNSEPLWQEGTFQTDDREVVASNMEAALAKGVREARKTLPKGKRVIQIRTRAERICRTGATTP